MPLLLIILSQHINISSWINIFFCFIVFSPCDFVFIQKRTKMRWLSTSPFYFQPNSSNSYCSSMIRFFLFFWSTAARQTHDEGQRKLFVPWLTSNDAFKLNAIKKCHESYCHLHLSASNPRNAHQSFHGRQTRLCG